MLLVLKLDLNVLVVFVVDVIENFLDCEFELLFLDNMFVFYVFVFLSV